MLEAGSSTRKIIVTIICVLFYWRGTACFCVFVQCANVPTTVWVIWLIVSNQYMSLSNFEPHALLLRVKGYIKATCSIIMEAAAVPWPRYFATQWEEDGLID